MPSFKIYREFWDEENEMKMLRGSTSLAPHNLLRDDGD